LCGRCGKGFYVLHFLDALSPEIRFCKDCVNRIGRASITEEEAQSISDVVADKLAAIIAVRKIEEKE